jgi:hypothetical protein
MILFLDDDAFRTRRFKRSYPSALTAETADQMIELLRNLTEPVDLVFLDHDLGGEQFVDSNGKNTGMEVVRWIMENKPPVEKFIVHSMNHGAAEIMTGRLETSGYDVERIPFVALISMLGE